jgi:hypothetical protein
MISIIICSVNPSFFKEIELNIKETIGIEYEIIGFDNREKKLSLCKVYNLCAQKAKYQYLCFIHEDMFFYTKNWGDIILDFYKSKTNVGIVGFSGSDIVPADFVEWNINKYHSKTHIVFAKNKSLPMSSFKCFFNYSKDYERVIILDGMFLFVSKIIWNENKFDEINYINFHLYDTDFSFSISRHYQNYVCTKILAVHRCHSKLNAVYISELLNFRNKWHQKLPVSINRHSKIINILTYYQQFYKNYSLYKTNGYSISMICKQLENIYENPYIMMFLLIFHRIISVFTNIKIRKFSILNKQN